MALRAPVYIQTPEGKKEVGRAEVMGRGHIEVYIPHDFQHEINIGRELTFTFGANLGDKPE